MGTIRLHQFSVLLTLAVSLGCGASETPDSSGPATDAKEEIEEEPEPEPESYLGGWLKAACADDIEGTGNKTGDIAEDFLQLEQNGETLRLHDFCDRTVWLVGSAFW